MTKIIFLFWHFKNDKSIFFSSKKADRAKQIKTHAIINENATNKVLALLREENARLKKMMQNGMVMSKDQVNDSKDINEMKKKWEEEMEAAMRDNERRINEV